MSRVFPWLIVVLAGCLGDPEPAPEQMAEPSSSACESQSASAETMAGGYSYRVQTGGGSGGPYYTLELHGDPKHLMFLNITMEWTANSPLSQALRMEAWLYDGLASYEQPSFQGPSPLAWSLRIRDLAFREGAGLALGPAEDQGLPASASATVIDQPVTLTIEEVYCSDVLHP